MNYNKFKNSIHQTLKIAVVLVLLVNSTNLVFAQTDNNLAESEYSDKFNNSINMCPVAVAFGFYSVNYEHLFLGKHGIVARVDYEAIPGTYTKANIESSGLSFTLNYRYHLSEKMESMFIGVYSRYRVFEGEGNINSKQFDFDLTDITLGINAGKRWVWSSGFNITFALGYGYSWRERNVSSSDSDVKKSIDDFEDDYDFIDPFYGEFSIGYAF